MTSKVFDKAHYDADDNAKLELIDWLNNRDFSAWVNEDQFGIDVQAIKYGEEYDFEVEVKHNWKGNNFPFVTVHWSARKLKFAKQSKRNWFVMFNHERTMALFVSGKTMLSSPVVTKDTKYTNAEKFVAVPLTDCKFRMMKEKW
jgi:hypothetical protein